MVLFITVVHSHMKFLQPEEIEKTTSQASIRNKEFLTLEETATFLGFSKSHLYKLTSKRLIPFYQPSGRKILFRTSELDAWISLTKRVALHDIEGELVMNNNNKR